MDPEFKWNLVKVLHKIKCEEKESNTLLFWIMKNGLGIGFYFGNNLYNIFGEKSIL